MRETLKALCNATFIGSEQNAKDLLIELISPYVDEVKTDLTGNVFGFIKGKSDKTVLLEAHIDEIGFTVTNVLDNGFVALSKVGGIDIRTLPSNTVKIHTAKGEVVGVFTSTPPHLAKDKSDEFSNLDEIYLDTGKNDAKEIIRIGDFATFDTTAIDLSDGYISSKSVDDRSGCVALIEVIKNISETGCPKDNIIVLFASGEELGNRGARIGAYNKNVDEAIIVDVSFGFSQGCDKSKCGECGKGAMIGVSPILNKDIQQKLIDIAQKNNIPHQIEAMNGLTSTDADVVTVTECGIKTALVSIPIKYMHTPVETVFVDDIKTVSDLITNYFK